MSPIDLLCGKHRSARDGLCADVSIVVINRGIISLVDVLQETPTAWFLRPLLSQNKYFCIPVRINDLPAGLEQGVEVLDLPLPA